MPIPSSVSGPRGATRRRCRHAAPRYPGRRWPARRAPVLGGLSLAAEALESCAPSCARPASTPATIVVLEVTARRRPQALRFSGSPTIRVDGRDVAPAPRRARRAHLPRLPPARRTRLAGPRSRRPARRPARRARRAARHDRRDRRPGPGLRAAGDGRRPRHGLTPLPRRRRVHVQPLPVRAGLARPARCRSRATTTPRGVRVLFVNPQRRRALSRATRSRRCASGSRPSGSWPTPYLHDESPGRRPRLRRPDDARRASSSTAPACVRYRGAPDADYDDPRAERAPGCATRSTRSWTAAEPDPRRRPSPSGCSVKWRAMSRLPRAVCRRRPSASSRLRTLPVALRGSSSRNTISRGTL